MKMRAKSLLTATLIAAATATSTAWAAPQMTLPQLTNPAPVKAETLKFEPFKGEVASAKPVLYTGRSAYRDTGRHYHRVGRVGFVPGSEDTRFGASRGYAALVGDKASGLGFYPLQQRYREGALRYHWSHPYRGAPGYGPYGNPVQQAVIADAVGSSIPFRTPSSAVNGYQYGVYDPIDGVGTPFFAGYYSAGTRDAEDGPEPIFGNALN
jgi:hypothetical protein